MVGDFYSYVEDKPSQAVALKLFQAVNENRGQRSQPALSFRDGFPNITRGCVKLKQKASAFNLTAQRGIPVFIITDLDTAPCPPGLINEWFDRRALHTNLVFRVAVREIEAWLLADRRALADYLNIPEENFSSDPENLKDPKRHLLDVIRRKGHRKRHKDMLPKPKSIASIGPTYNKELCTFIHDHWSPNRAVRQSQSLRRALDALVAF